MNKGSALACMAIFFGSSAWAGQGGNWVSFNYVLDNQFEVVDAGQTIASVDNDGFDLRGEFTLRGPFHLYLRYEDISGDQQTVSQGDGSDTTRIDLGIGASSRWQGLNLLGRVKYTDLDIPGHFDSNGFAFEIALSADSHARELNLDPGSIASFKLGATAFRLDELKGVEWEGGVDIWFARDIAGTVTYRLLSLDSDAQREVEFSGFRLGVMIGY